MVIVMKKDGSTQITTELTQLNDHVIPEHYPQPRIKDIILKTADPKSFPILT